MIFRQIFNNPEKDSKNNFQQQEALFHRATGILCLLTIGFTVLGVSLDTIPRWTNKIYLLVVINMTFVGLQFINIFLFFKKIISVKTTFIIYASTLFINIVIAYHEYLKNPSQIAEFAFRDILLQMLVIFVSAFLAGRFFTYLIAFLTSGLYLGISFLSGNSFLIENISIVIMILLGIAFSTSLFNSLLVKSFGSLREAASQIQKLTNFRQELIQMVIHDLKVPLNAIIHLAKTKRSLVDSSGSISNYARQMLDHVSNILDINKLEEVELKLRQGTHDILNMIRESVKDMQILCEGKNLSIDIFSSGRYIVKCDKELIKRVVENLLSNAIHHSPVNGKIIVTLKQLSDERTTVSVADEGPGIPGNLQTHIFGKFYSGANSHTKVSTGLGLTFCKLALEAHNQKITVKSEPGEGAEFTFTLEIVHSKKETNLDEDRGIKKGSFNFSKHENDLIQACINQLRDIPIYRTSEIFTILNTLERSDYQNVRRWIAEMQDAVFTCNEEYYNKLKKNVR